MNFTVDAPRLLSEPGLRSPMAIGLLVRLVASLGDGESSMEFNLRAWTESLTATKSQIERAMMTLAKCQIIEVDKSGGSSRGTWLVNLSGAMQFVSAGGSVPAPKETPIRVLMEEWDSLYREKVGSKYWRTNADFFREKRLWVELYQEMGDDLGRSLKIYFNTERFSRWEYAFSIFYRNAERLLADSKTQNTWRF